MRKILAASLAAVLFAGTFPVPARAAETPTVTPIKHIVVIFPENISFDHYFGTYPNAENKNGETPFTYVPSTWTGHNVANNLVTPLDPNNGFKPITGLNLLTANPNSSTGSGASFNGLNAANPFRLAPTQSATADMSHAPKPEQTAYNNGKVDQFPGSTGTAGPPPSIVQGPENTKGLVMGYFDGNSVTAMWNYANHFALNDNTYTSQFGPSTPGAINLISGQTNGFAAYTNVVSGKTLLHTSHEVFDGQGGFTLIGDAEPLGDVCSNTSSDNVRFSGKNIGDLLNAKGITWGWFQGGFDLTVTNSNGTTGCARSTPNVVAGYGGVAMNDYVEHHQPFQYYASTANLTHARPSSIAAIGSTYEADGVTKDPANHQYDTNDFFTALSNGNLPSVSFLKAQSFQDAHPGNSDPTDEQTFTVNVINAVMNSPFWDSTAIVITYDDSDGWYDHQMPPIVNPSYSSYVDVLNGPSTCKAGVQQGKPVHTGMLPAAPTPGAAYSEVLGRCGFGTRIPLLVISPYAKQNYISHELLNQASVIRSIEDNWLGGERIQSNGGSFDAISENLFDMLDLTKTPAQIAASKLILDPTTGAIVK
jgi:phospholipase C